MSALLTVPVLNLLTLWEDLVLAREGCSGFGGDTAELYAYRFMPRNPFTDDPRIDHPYKAEAIATARLALLALLDLFAEQCEVQIEVDGMSLDRWRESAIPFNHRVPVRVIAERSWKEDAPWRKSRP